MGRSVAGHTAILRGTLKALRLARHLLSTWAHVSAALRVTAVTASSCVLTITAPTSWPRRASGIPTTAASRTPGSVRKKASTSDACTWGVRVRESETKVRSRQDTCMFPPPLSLPHARTRTHLFAPGVDAVGRARNKAQRPVCIHKPPIPRIQPRANRQ